MAARRSPTSPDRAQWVPSPQWPWSRWHDQTETTSTPEIVDTGTTHLIIAGETLPVSDIVELTLPVKADLVVLARLTAATVASRANFDIEEIEDLRLAVDELCVSLVQDHADGRLSLLFCRDEDQIEVEGTFRPSPGRAADPPARGTGGLSERILDALVDQHGYDDHDDAPRAWLRKRRIRPQV